MTSHLVILEREADAYVASEQAALLAGEAGFDRYACGDVETAVSEICSNALRHADGGWAAIRRLPDRFEVSVTDRGPGFLGPRKGPRGLGIGLEGTRRLMGALDISTVPGGSRVTASRPLPSDCQPTASRWAVTTVARPRAGQAYCGDAVAVHSRADSFRVALADGLGSGLHASLAARRVLDGMDLSAHDSPAEALLTAHLSARDTRGAAAAVAYLDASGHGSHAAVGDVSCAVAGRGELGTRPGIVGYGDPHPADSHFQLQGDDRLLLWTDGINGARVKEMLSREPREIADLEQIVLQSGSPREDGTLVVVQETP